MILSSFPRWLFQGSISRKISFFSNSHSKELVTTNLAHGTGARCLAYAELATTNVKPPSVIIPSRDCFQTSSNIAYTIFAQGTLIIYQKDFLVHDVKSP